MPFGPFDHEIGGLTSALGPACPCATGAQNVYLSEIIPPPLTESTVTFSAAADADGIDAIATTKVPNARPMQILRFIVLPLPREKFL